MKTSLQEFPLKFLLSLVILESAIWVREKHFTGTIDSSSLDDIFSFVVFWSDVALLVFIPKILKAHITTKKVISFINIALLFVVLLGLFSLQFISFDLLDLLIISLFYIFSISLYLFMTEKVRMNRESKKWIKSAIYRGLCTIYFLMTVFFIWTIIYFE